jgi:hypothetical protein
MIDGCDDDTVNCVLGRISNAPGLRLVCVWDVHDTYGVGGNSQFYVEEAGGRLRELRGDLWRWLNGDPADPSTPASPGITVNWIGQAADFTADHLPCTDGFHNYAIQDEA